MREAHQLHLIRHQFDNSCRDCLLVKVRSLNPEWRRVSPAGGYFIPDSLLTKFVLREYLESKQPAPDPDKGHKSAFELLGYPSPEIELSPVEGMSFESLPGTPTTPYRTGEISLDESDGIVGQAGQYLSRNGENAALVHATRELSLWGRLRSFAAQLMEAAL